MLSVFHCEGRLQALWDLGLSLAPHHTEAASAYTAATTPLPESQAALNRGIDGLRQHE